MSKKLVLKQIKACQLTHPTPSVTESTEKVIFTDDDEDDRGSGHGDHSPDGGDDNDGFHSDRWQDSESSNV